LSKDERIELLKLREEHAKLKNKRQDMKAKGMIDVEGASSDDEPRRKKRNDESSSGSGSEEGDEYLDQVNEPLSPINQ